ncbi:hypothetical protein BDV32DRAFT_77934 [Aspergillus pseudonomiae]|nr:hypothetical protein BDV32DRAFT_77934 [Aspergillus pseudonomiae]
MGTSESSLLFLAFHPVWNTHWLNPFGWVSTLSGVMPNSQHASTMILFSNGIVELGRMVDQAMRSTCITDFLFAFFFYYSILLFFFFFFRISVFNFHLPDRGIIKCLNYLGKKLLELLPAL